MKRTFQAACEMQRMALQNHAQQVYCVGTQVLRNAPNREEFLSRLEKRCRLKLEILSGEQEAFFTFSGAVETIGSEKQPVWAMDIGGGSLELIYGDSRKIRFMKSFPLGMVYVKEKLELGDFLSAEEQAKIRELIGKEMAALLPQWRSPFLLGIGGTFTTLAAIHQQLKDYEFEKIDGYRLTNSQIAEVFIYLNRLSPGLRRQLPGMEPGREDVILPAIVILEAVLEYFQIDMVTVSARGLRFGVLKWKLNLLDAEERIPE